MAASRNSRQAALKMLLALKVWLKILCLALGLITFAPHCGAIKIRKFQTNESVLRSYGRSSPDDLITGNNAYRFHEGDVRTHSAEASKDSNPAVLSELDDESCNYQVDLQSTQTSQFSSEGLPLFTVTFTNTCLTCSFSDIHINCGDFESPTSLDPAIFLRLGVNDCLLLGGGALAPEGTVTFQYESTSEYPMVPGSANTGC